MRKLSYKIARLLPRLAILVFLLLAAMGGSASYASPPSPPGTPLPIPQLLPGTLSLPPGLVGELPKVPRHPKLDTTMAHPLWLGQTAALPGIVRDVSCSAS